MIAIIAIAVFILLLRVGFLTSKSLPHTGHWHHYFENFNYSSRDFYGLVWKAIQQREIPRVSGCMVTHKVGGFFSAKREYLRISRDELFFDVCAAPFAKGFFISWWQASHPSLSDAFIMVIPVLGRTALRNKRDRTYFELDTELMFKESIHHTIVETIEQITAEKGIRSLSGQQRQLTTEVV